MSVTDDPAKTIEASLPDDAPSVVVKNLGKSFGGVAALRDVSFEIGRGEVVALLGPNGAGKTTTVNILSTLARPDRGSASVAGYDVVSEAAGVRRALMLTGQHVALDELLTGRENLILFGRLQHLRGAEAKARADELIREFDLAYAADRRLGTYSGGMRRRIDIACGLVVPPEVVFLDEPTTGLDPRSRQVIWDLVTRFKGQGIATLLTTQYLEEADALSDRIIVIDHGVVVAEGTADELKERTGGSYCEVVPKDPADLPAIAAALGTLLPEKNRAAVTSGSDRLTVPAPEGAKTLLEVLGLLSPTKIELADVALRRPSLDDVFLSLTDLPSPSDPDQPASDAVTPPRRRVPRGAPLRRVLAPVLAGLLVGGVVAALGLTGDTDPPGTSETPRAAAVFTDVEGGACLTWPPNAPAEASTIDCEDDHLFEVAQPFQMSNGQAPCQLAVQRYLGPRYDPDGKFTVAALWPGNADQRPADGERVLCGLQLLGADGQPVAFKGIVAQQDQSRVWPVGTCLGIDPATNQPTTGAVECSAPHAVEITGTANLGDGFFGPPPAAAEQDVFLEEACSRTAEAYLSGASLEARGLRVWHGTVSPASWSAGSRLVSCGVGATAGEDRWATVTGSVTGLHLIDGQPPVTRTAVEPTQEYETSPATTEYVPETVQTPTYTPTPTTTGPPTTPSTSGPTPTESTTLPTTTTLPPGGFVVAVPGFSPVTMTPTPPPPPPGEPSPLPPPPPPSPAPGAPTSTPVPLPEGPRAGP